MYSIRGPDIDRLQFYARTLVERMEDAGGYADLMLSYETGKPEVALEITRERAADLGVPALQIGRTISALFAGYKATTFEERGERYDVRVQVRPEYRDDPEKLVARARAGAERSTRAAAQPGHRAGSAAVRSRSTARAALARSRCAATSTARRRATADEEIMRFAKELGIDGEYEFEADRPDRAPARVALRDHLRASFSRWSRST